MKDNILDQYKDINKKIQVPDSLKEDTIKLMKKQRKQKTKSYTGYAYAAAVAGIILLGVASLQIKEKSEAEITICEALDENTVQEEIELSKGNMYFQSISGEFLAPGLHLGSLEGEKVVVTEEDYFEYLGKNPLPEYFPKGMVKQDLGEQLLTQKEDGSFVQDVFSIMYKGEADSFIEILLSTEGIPQEDLTEELTPSLINDIEVKTAYYKDKQEETVFIAYFQVEGIGYKVKSKGISQEEFIKTVLSAIK